LEFDELAAALKRLDEASLVEKPDALRQLLSALPHGALARIVAILAGEPLVENPHRPSRRSVEVALGMASGRSGSEVREELRRTGNLPETAEHLLQMKSQKGLVSEMMTLEEALRRLEEVSVHERLGSPAVSLRALLSRCGPRSARLALSIALGESHAYVPENLLVEEVSRRLAAEDTFVRALAHERGWRKAVELLNKRLSGAPQTIVRRSGDGEEGRQNRTQEGDPEAEG